MRKSGCAFLVCFLALNVTSRAQADDQAEARAIIDKAIQAAGGEAKLDKFRAHTWKEKGTYYGMGDGIPYTGSYAVQWPGQFRMEIEGYFTMVLNNDKGWMKMPGGDTLEMSKEQLAEHKENHYA